jgi:hypothetical protein
VWGQISHSARSQKPPPIFPTVDEPVADEEPALFDAEPEEGADSSY